MSLYVLTIYIYKNNKNHPTSGNSSSFPFISVVSCAYLVYNPAGDSHAIKDCHIDNGGHSSIVDGLRAIRPHVWTLCQVDVAGRQTGRRQEQVMMCDFSLSAQMYSM